MSSKVTTISPTLRAMSESQFMAAIVELAQWSGWLVHFVPDALYRRSFAVSKRGADQGDSGFPDLVMARDDRLIFAELKSHTGRLRPMQEVWLHRLASVPGVETYCWRPGDWDRIEAMLSRDRSS